MTKQDENLNNHSQILYAAELLEKDLPYKKILELLNSGSILERQAGALKLNKIENTDDAQILVSNLVGQDGKVREAVSLKINELMQNPQYSCYFQEERIYKIFLYAITDINSNICRNIISAIATLKNNVEFCEYFTKNLLEITQNLIETVSQFDFQDGKYKVNKEVFKLYWCLEAVFTFSDCIPTEEIKKIIIKTKDIDEYTIREKTAKILTKDFKDEELDQIRQQLKNDKNYYVRRF